MAVPNEQVSDELKDQLTEEKDIFLEKVRGEKLKKLYNFPVKDDSDKKVTSSTNFFLYLTQENNVYLNYYNGQTVLYETTPYHMIGVDWMEYMQNEVSKFENGTIAESMLAGPASKIAGILTEKEEQENKANVVMTLQNQETHEVRMFAFICSQQELQNLKVIPTTPLIEDETVVDK